MPRTYDDDVNHDHEAAKRAQTACNSAMGARKALVDKQLADLQAFQNKQAVDLKAADDAVRKAELDKSELAKNAIRCGFSKWLSERAQFTACMYGCGVATTITHTPPPAF